MTRSTWRTAVLGLAAATAVVCGSRVDALEAADTPPRPRRIVTLAPHLAELVFAAGAGESLVAVSAHSDHPPAAARLPVVGDAFAVDQERLAMLEPDLLLAWQNGTPAHVVDELRGRGFRVEVIRTRGLDDVAPALLRIGKLAGTRTRAARAAAAFEHGLAALGARWRDAAPIRVFYQVSRRPLYTVNGDHYISELLVLCGGENVFAELGALAPLVSAEAVLARDPEVLLAAAVPGSEPFADWARWPAMSANRLGNHYTVSAARIGRATPRLLAAGREVCARLEQGRERRRRAGGDG